MFDNDYTDRGAQNSRLNGSRWSAADNDLSQWLMVCDESTVYVCDHKIQLAIAAKRRLYCSPATFDNSRLFLANRPYVRRNYVYNSVVFRPI